MAINIHCLSQCSFLVLLRHDCIGRMMKLARRHLDDPERLVELEKQLEEHMNELIAEAADAGYSTAEMLMVFKLVCDRQHTALSQDPDPAEDQ